MVRSRWWGLAALLVAGVAVASFWPDGRVAAQEGEEEPTEMEVERPPEEPDGDETIQSDLSDVLQALEDAGLPGALQEIAVQQPWIPVPGAGILALNGASAEVYVLSVVEAEQAIGNISGENAAFQPPANATIWRQLTMIVILQDAPSHPEIEQTLHEHPGIAGAGHDRGTAFSWTGWSARNGRGRSGRAGCGDAGSAARVRERRVGGHRRRYGSGPVAGRDRGDADPCCAGARVPAGRADVLTAGQYQRHAPETSPVASSPL